MIRAARKHLAALEAQSLQAQGQFDLFAASGNAAARDSADTRDNHDGATILTALAEIDPDSLTPREALEALYRLKQLSQGNAE